MRSSFRLLVQWRSFGEVATASSLPLALYCEVRGICAVPAVPSTRTSPRFSGTHGAGGRHPAPERAPRWA